ncbi:MAG: peptide-methionine (S)-S-oxide reductase MsrA [Treponema sp.]|nr:peptide-methionine (S)-S-oxide reductase MsrA [Treponema sp.]
MKYSMLQAAILLLIGFVLLLQMLEGVNGMEMNKKRESIVLGGGCFWCIEAVYERIEGIESAVSGYAGGKTENPTYEQVCTGLTGHAEVVKLEYNPEKISLEQILDIFFKAHDPTSENRQGADVGTQYRSIILYTNDDQKRRIEDFIRRLTASKAFAKPVVTQIEPLATFWPAEEYHQDYYERHPFAGYCRVVIAPKLDKLGLPVDTLIK